MGDPVSLPLWTIPVAKEAIRNRALIRKAFDEAINLALGRKCNLVFTGTFGVGKTVLRDYLNGDAFEQGYIPPPDSVGIERGKVRDVADRRVRVAVVPGQDSAPRLAAVDNLLLGQDPVDGIVHVVANGFVTLRSAAASELVRKEGIKTLRAYRDYQLRREVDDLVKTLEVVRRSVVRHGSPTWMLVAATKADLYPEQLRTAQDRYSSNGHGPFVDAIEDFIYRVGADNFRWDAAPVCAWLDDFEWGSEKRPSSVNVQSRDQMLLNFARTLGHFCRSDDG